jgi:hypothetical protein
MLDLPELAPSAWQPRSLLAPPRRTSLRRRAWVLATVVAGHLGIALLVARGMAPEPADAIEDAVTEVRFVAPPPAAERPPILLPQAPPPLAIEPAKAVERPAKTPRKKQAPVALAAVDEPSSKQPLQLYDGNGRIKLPDGFIERLDAQSGDQRVFEYQVPGLATSKHFFDRPAALTYEHNRFEKYYRPDQDVLTALLTRLVEGTTKEVRIKLPGNPRAKIVCTVSLLALGGACGVVQNQGNYVIADDPNTLSLEEQAQCQAWWDRIVDARSQDIWRKTRDLYEVECRKPLERKPPVPPGQEPMPGRITY